MFAHAGIPSEAVEPKRNCTVIRAVLNMAASIGESVTILTPSSSAGPTEVEEVECLFAMLGVTKRLPESKLNAAAALASSSIALYASLISAATDGALDKIGEEDLSREEALWISA